jgi:hypothetical protein
MGRKATVGARAGHSRFAREVTTYLNKVREDSGLSVRRVSALSAGERSNTWWADIFNGSKILTTNDIDYIATELLGINPYTFIANARRHSAGDLLPLVTFNVGPHPEDFQISDDTGDELPSAAETRRTPED